jgi:YihY family inner membrane protein
MARTFWAKYRRTVPVRFAHKAFNDWIFELAGMLAYYLLLATVPIFLLLIGGVGIALRQLRHDTQQRLINALARTFPSEISSGLITAVTNDLKESSRALLVIGLVLALLFGSRLLVRLDECVTIIYRGRPRTFFKQNLIGLGLTILFVILAPVMFLAAAVPSFLTSAIAHEVFRVTTVPGWVGQPIGFLGAYLAAFLWLLAIYMLVPSQHVGLRNSWPGAAIAALLLIIYELAFPWIARALLHPGNYGETAGFLILLLSFFYYFAFLLLIGAEVNSWLAGHRETDEDVPTMLHYAIIHRQLPQVVHFTRDPAAREGEQAPTASDSAAQQEEPPAANGASSKPAPHRPTEPDMRTPALS